MDCILFSKAESALAKILPSSTKVKLSREITTTPWGWTTTLDCYTIPEDTIRQIKWKELCDTTNFVKSDLGETLWMPVKSKLHLMYKDCPSELHLALSKSLHLCEIIGATNNDNRIRVKFVPTLLMEIQHLEFRIEGISKKNNRWARDKTKLRTTNHETSDVYYWLCESRKYKKKLAARLLLIARYKENDGFFNNLPFKAFTYIYLCIVCE